MVDRGPAGRQDIIDAVALLPLDATGPHSRLMTQLHSIGNSDPDDLTDGDRVGRPVLDLTKSNIPGCAAFAGYIRSPEKPIRAADSASLVPTVGFVIREGPRCKSNCKTHADAHLRRPAVARTPVGLNRSGRLGYMFFEQIPSANSC